MNVLLVVPWDNVGGVCSVVNQVARHMREQGHRVSLLLPGASSWPVEDVSREGHQLFRLYARPTSFLRGSLRHRIAFVLTLPLTLVALGFLVRRLRINAVNVHFPGDEGIHFAILRRLGLIKLITSVHGTDMLPDGVRLPQRQRGLCMLLNASDSIVTPSDSYSRCVRDVWPEIRDDAAATIPNGINPDELGYSSTTSDTATEPPYILSILHMVQYKGVDVLIRAFAALRAEFPSVSLKLISGGPQQDEYRALAANLGISDRVEFLGARERPEVASQVRGCTLFVLPSRSNSESFGISAAEAMAVDRAVIGSRVGGLPELIVDEVTGILVPPGDVDALTGAMRRLLVDAPLREQLGQSAGLRVRRDFLWAKTGELYEAIFRRAVGWGRGLGRVA